MGSQSRVEVAPKGRKKTTGPAPPFSTNESAKSELVMGALSVMWGKWARRVERRQRDRLRLFPPMRVLKIQWSRRPSVSRPEGSKEGNESKGGSKARPAKAGELILGRRGVHKVAPPFGLRRIRSPSTTALLRAPCCDYYATVAAANLLQLQVAS